VRQCGGLSALDMCPGGLAGCNRAGLENIAGVRSAVSGSRPLCERLDLAALLQQSGADTEFAIGELGEFSPYQLRLHRHAHQCGALHPLALQGLPIGVNLVSCSAGTGCEMC